MISRARLRLGAQEWGVGDVVVENDYVLGWLLWGIGSDPTLREQWVFKGGTCLKKGGATSATIGFPRIFPGSRLHRPEGRSRRALSAGRLAPTGRLAGLGAHAGSTTGC